MKVHQAQFLQQIWGTLILIRCLHHWADDTRRIVHEFVRAGFRRVGVVGGGYAALTREQLAALVTDDVTPRSEAEGGASSSSKAAAAVGMIGGAIKNTFNFAKRRAKPAPVSPPS